MLIIPDTTVYSPAIIGSNRSLFTPTPLPDWRTLRRLRMAVCPYPNCKFYTVAYTLNIDGSPGDAIAAWLGESTDLPFYPWWDDVTPWCWFTTSFITTTSGSNQSGNVPGTWNSANNSIEVIGSGGGAGSNFGANGGAAAYAKSVNITLVQNAAVTFFLNAGGTGTPTNSNGTTTPPTAGPDAWYNGTTLGGSSCGAKGGFAGDNTSFGAPGLSSGCIFSGPGSLAFSGGAATSQSGSSNGGGGAGGPAGVGGASGGGTGYTGANGNGGCGGGANGGGSPGATISNSANIGFAGGTSASTGSQTGAAGGGGAGSNVQGTAGTSGSGGGGGWADLSNNATAGGAGGAGQEWDVSHGSGGGAGGGAIAPTTGGTYMNGPNGALYGAGGGSGGHTGASGTVNGSGGAGAQAIINLTWTALDTLMMAQIWM